MVDMSLWQAVLWFSVKFVFLALVAFAGIMLGIALRKRHNKNNISEDKTDAEVHS